MLIKQFSSINEVARYGAQQIANQIIRKPDSVFYLATGQTMIAVYAALVQIFNETHFSFQKVSVFNLDEYIGLDIGDPHSFHQFMHEHLFDQIDINHDHIFFTDGSVSNPYAEAEAYLEILEKFGPADFALLGLGLNGHIGFNEPGSSFNLKTRVVDLTDKTRETNAQSFNSVDRVPRQAITIGIAEIIKAKKIILVATGKHKHEILLKLKKSSITKDLPASVLKGHKQAELVTDQRL